MYAKGAFKRDVMQMGVGGLKYSGYECVRFNVISVTSGWMGSNCQEKNVM